MDKKKTIKTIEINDIGYISFDGENYYIDTAQAVNLSLSDKRLIYVFDCEGNIIKNINVENDNSCHFGYKDFLLFDQYVELSKNKVYYNKEQNSIKETDFINIG